MWVNEQEKQKINNKINEDGKNECKNRSYNIKENKNYLRERFYN